MSERSLPAQTYPCGCEDGEFVVAGMRAEGSSWFCRDYVMETGRCARPGHGEERTDG